MKYVMLFENFSFHELADKVKAAKKVYDQEEEKFCINDEELENPFTVCTFGAGWLRDNFFPGAVIMGYNFDENPTAKIGDGEGGHDFLFYESRYIIDFWYHNMYDSSAPILIDTIDQPEITKHYYGDPNAWVKLPLNESSSYLSESNVPKYLYHVTNISKLKEIESYGLLPTFGDTVTSIQAWQYYNDEYIQPDNLRDGILFFSDKPEIGYANYGKTLNIDDVVLCIVENNKTIFRKYAERFKGEKFYDYKGNIEQYSIDYIPLDQLPPFIENGDYFSFKEQECVKILYGKPLINFLNKKFPDILKADTKQNKAFESVTLKAYNIIDTEYGDDYNQVPFKLFEDGVCIKNEQNWDLCFYDNLYYNFITDSEIERCLSMDLSNIDITRGWSQVMKTVLAYEKPDIHAMRIAKLVLEINNNQPIKPVNMFFDDESFRHSIPCFIEDGNHRIRALQYLKYDYFPAYISGNFAEALIKYLNQ